MTVKRLKTVTPSEPVRTHTLVRSAGINSPHIISRLHYKGTIPTVKQLFVFNPWDADAQKVELDFSPECLSGRDYGYGIAPENLASFVRFGDSLKLEEATNGDCETHGKLTPKGRRRFGELGFGTLLLEQICGRYHLETWRNGSRCVIDESFNGREMALGQELSAPEYKCDPKLNGTLLQLYDLKLDADYSMELLRRRLQWEVPILPDFQIILNGEAITSKAIDNAKRFKFEVDGKKMGYANGDLYLCSRVVPMAGIYVYVNKRAIGDSKGGDAQSRLLRLVTKRSLGDKIIGIINADSLGGAIMLGAETFVEGHPGVKELDDRLKEHMKIIRAYHDKTSVAVKVGKLKKGLQDYAENVRQYLVREGLEVLATPNCVRFAEDGEIKDPKASVHYDKENRLFFLNPEHPSFEISNEVRQKEIERSILHTIIDALALQTMNKTGNLLANYVEARRNLWEFLRGKGQQPELIEDITPLIMYSAVDLAKLSQYGMNARAIREYVEHGVLPSEGGAIKGADFSRFEKDFLGFRSLYEVISSKELGSGFTFHYERAINILRVAGANARPLAYNVTRKKEEPFFVLEERFAEGVLQRIDQADLRRKEGIEEVKRIFGDFSGSYHSVKDLMEMFGEGHEKKVAEAMQYARNHAEDNHNPTTLNQRMIDTTQHFHLGDVVRAYQLMRGCSWVRDYRP